MQVYIEVSLEQQANLGQCKTQSISEIHIILNLGQCKTQSIYLQAMHLFALSYFNLYFLYVASKISIVAFSEISIASQTNILFLAFFCGSHVVVLYQMRKKFSDMLELEQ